MNKKKQKYKIYFLYSLININKKKQSKSIVKKKALLSPLLNINKFNTNNIDNKNITIFKFILGFIKKNKANNKGVSLAIYDPKMLS